MSKKDNEKRIQARELYEQGGFSLADIARKLEINQNTVKSWKKRDKWIAPAPKNAPKRKPRKNASNGAKKDGRGCNSNSLENLDKGRKKAPNFEPGNQAALKHGLYANYVNPEYLEIYESLDEIDDVKLLEEVIRIKFTNYAGVQSKLNLEDNKDSQAESQSARVLGGLIVDHANLLEKQGDTTEDDEFINAIKYAADKVWEENE